MRMKTIALAAAGVSQWIPVDWVQASFAIGVNCNCQGGGTYSYKLQHGYSDSVLDTVHVNITRSTTTATIVFPSGVNGDGESVPGHGLKVGDNLQIFAAGAPFDGSNDVASVVDTHTVTITVANSGLTASPLNIAYAKKVYVEDDATIASGTTGSKEASVTVPCFAIRLNAATVTSGQIMLTVGQGHNVG